MMRRAVRRVGRPSMLGTAARTAVVAGTATAVVGGVSHRQQEKAQQASDAQAYQQMQQQQAMEAAAQQAAAPAAAPAPAPDPIAELERLAQLKQQGILTDEEFAAAKAKVLGT
jgi:outer membrane protein OmpA-like peptidoglycan-associated protein